MRRRRPPSWSRRCLARLEVSGVAALLDSLGLWPRLMLPLFLLTLLRAGLGQLHDPIAGRCRSSLLSPSFGPRGTPLFLLRRRLAFKSSRRSRCRGTLLTTMIASLGRRGGLNCEGMCFQKYSVWLCQARPRRLRTTHLGCMPATGFRTMLGLCRRLVSSCGAAARPPQARGGFQRAATVARAGEHRSWPPLGLPLHGERGGSMRGSRDMVRGSASCVRTARADTTTNTGTTRTKTTRRGSVPSSKLSLQPMRPTHAPDILSSSRPPSSQYEDDEDFDETPLNDKGPKDVETLRGISGPRVADTLPMPEPGSAQTHLGR